MHKLFRFSLFNKIADILLPWLIISLIASLAAGLYFALYNSPPDYQQGDSVRIMYVHVPVASLSLAIYVFMAVCSVSYIIWRNPLSAIICYCSAPIGMIYCIICIITGAIWGYPIWGAWWVWDARLTSMLILLFFYFGYILLYNSFTDEKQSAFMSSCLLIIGVVNVPIVKFSVDWWSSLHQPASILRSGGMAIHSSMLYPLFIMMAFFTIFYLTTLIISVKQIKNNKIIARNSAMLYNS
ncbi:MAG: heme ABC transporter permease CcmC [Pseudomonadota bacterium]